MNAKNNQPQNRREILSALVLKLVSFFFENAGCLIINLVLAGMLSIVLALLIFMLPKPLFHPLASFFLYLWHVWLAAALLSLLIAGTFHMYRRGGGTFPTPFGDSIMAFFNRLDPNPRQHAILDGSLLLEIFVSFVLLGIWTFLVPKCLTPEEAPVSLMLIEPAGLRTPIPFGSTIRLTSDGGEVRASIALSNLIDPEYQLDCQWATQGDGSLSPLPGCSASIRPGPDQYPDNVILYLAKDSCAKHGPYGFFVIPR